MQDIIKNKFEAGFKIYAYKYFFLEFFKTVFEPTQWSELFIFCAFLAQANRSSCSVHNSDTTDMKTHKNYLHETLCHGLGASRIGTLY